MAIPCVHLRTMVVLANLNVLFSVLRRCIKRSNDLKRKSCALSGKKFVKYPLTPHLRGSRGTSAARYLGDMAISDACYLPRDTPEAMRVPIDSTPIGLKGRW